MRLHAARWELRVRQGSWAALQGGSGRPPGGWCRVAFRHQDQGAGP